MDKNGAVIIEELFPVSFGHPNPYDNSQNPHTTNILESYFGDKPNQTSCSISLQCPCESDSEGDDCCCCCQDKDLEPLWHVYLTSAGIHVVGRKITFLYCCHSPNPLSTVIPFIDVEDIQVYGQCVHAGHCNYGTKLDPSRIILLEYKVRYTENSPLMMICCCMRNNIHTAKSVAKIITGEDATSFVQAVRRQMNSMARE